MDVDRVGDSLSICTSMDFSCTILFYSILGCVLPLQEVASARVFHLSLSLCYPHPYRSLLPRNVISPTTFGLPTDLTPSVCHSVLLIVHLLSFIRAMCPSPFPFHIGYALDYVCHFHAHNIEIVQLDHDSEHTLHVSFSLTTDKMICPGCSSSPAPCRVYPALKGRRGSD